MRLLILGLCVCSSSKLKMYEKENVRIFYFISSITSMKWTKDFQLNNKIPTFWSSDVQRKPILLTTHIHWTGLHSTETFSLDSSLNTIRLEWLHILPPVSSRGTQCNEKFLYPSKSPGQEYIVGKQQQSQTRHA